MQKIFLGEVGFVAPMGELKLRGTGLENVEQFGRSQGHLWEQIDLPLYAKSVGSPIILSFCGLPPILYSRYVYCIHDMAVFRHPEFFSKLYGFNPCGPPQENEGIKFLVNPAPNILQLTPTVVPVLKDVLIAHLE